MGKAGFTILNAESSEFYGRETMGYLEKIRNGDPDANPFFTLMGVTVVVASGGEAGLAMTVRPDMANGVGWLQGGMFTALADEAMALALYQKLEDGEGIATISENTSFFKGAQAGTNLYATGRVIRKGRRVAFVEGEVRETGKMGRSFRGRWHPSPWSGKSEPGFSGLS